MLEMLFMVWVLFAGIRFLTKLITGQSWTGMTWDEIEEMDEDRKTIDLHQDDHFPH